MWQSRTSVLYSQIMNIHIKYYIHYLYKAGRLPIFHHLQVYPNDHRIKIERLNCDTNPCLSHQLGHYVLISSAANQKQDVIGFSSSKIGDIELHAGVLFERGG